MLISINSKEYKAINLKDYIIYDDNEVVIFDMRHLLSNMDLPEYLDTLEEKNVEFNWMQEIYNQLKNHPNGILEKKK